MKVTAKKIINHPVLFRFEELTNCTLYEIVATDTDNTECLNRIVLFADFQPRTPEDPVLTMFLEDDVIVFQRGLPHEWTEWLFRELREDESLTLSNSKN